MNCEEIRELLSLYIDNKLEEEQMIEIERHLLVCDACKKEFEEIVLVINAMKNLTEVEIPAQFDSGLREELKKAAESIRKSDKRNKRIRYSSIAAVFLIGIFSIAMYNSINTENPTEIEAIAPSQDTMKMMAEPSLEESSKELDQAMNDYITQLDELYKGQTYVLLDWVIESPQVYIINIQLENVSEAGDVSFETISYKGQDGKLWKIE